MSMRNRMVSGVVGVVASSALVVGIVGPAVDRGPEPHGLLAPGAVPTAPSHQRPAAFGRVRRGPVAADLCEQRAGQVETHGSLHRCGSLR